MTTTNTTSRRNVGHSLDLQRVLERAAVIGPERAVAEHRGELTAPESELILGLTETEIKELCETAQALGAPKFTAADNNF